jgi:hypothetical protein
LLETHLGQQAQRPGTPGLAESTRRLVEDALERFRLGLVEDRRHALRAAFLFLEAARPLLPEGVEGVVDGPDGAADVRGDRGGVPTVGTGQQDLGAAERERLTATKSGLERPPLSVGQLPNEQGWFHGPLFGPSRRLPSN